MAGLNENNGKFNNREKAAFAPGGNLSTPKKRDAVSSSDFLMPAEKKYPYKVAGKISCDLLKAAVSRAGENGESAVKSHAQSLYETHCT